MNGNIPGDQPTADAGEVSQEMLAAAADGVVVVDESGLVRFGNPAAGMLLGVPAAELPGTPLGYEITPGQAAEIELTAADGSERILDVRTAATMVADERLLVAVLRDVTHRRMCERALQSALERQTSALSVAAHELNSPLAAIGVLARLLADDQITMAPPEREKVAGRIAELADRLQLLMRRLLTSAKLEAGGSRAEPEQLRVLEVIIDQLAVIDPEPGSITVSCSPGLAVVADRSEFGMMLANYLDNALTHAKPPVEVSVHEAKGWAEIQVSDHGPGVPDAFVPQLFERFTRAPDAGRTSSGVGLGLWIVRTLARANHGDAGYEPGERDGSRFYLRLPSASRAA
jgi:signal transduction histidine kinase